MTNCLFCYQPVETDEYHPTCSKNFFGTAQVPILELDKEQLNKLAQITVNERLALTGVQPKISLSLSGEKGNKRLTLIGLWGDYILFKPEISAGPNSCMPARTYGQESLKFIAVTMAMPQNIA